MSGDHEFEIGFYESLLRRDGDDLAVMELLADLYTKAGRIDDGLALDLRIVQMAPDDPGSHYNLACSLALKRRLAEALAALRTAIAKGYRDFDWMRKDPDLANLRADPRFAELLAEPEAASE